MRAKRWLVFLLPILSLNSGCYLAHVAAGQIRLLHARKPIAAVIADPDTPDDVRAGLRLVREARAYASDLGLDVGARYTSYVAWPGDGVVTTVVAARPGEVTPAPWRFPLLGEVPYKGYFDPARAAEEAARQRARGLDTCVVDVPAYSTLGWFEDPVTEPMLRAGHEALVETVIHELVHATVFVRDAARFNEGVATFVGEEGAVRFYAARGGPEAAARERLRVAESRRLREELMRLRGEIAGLYASRPAGPERDAARAAYDAAARARIAALPLSTRDAPALARDLRTNDACLALYGTYAGDLPDYERALAALGGDLRPFVARIVAAAPSADPRAALLDAVAAPEIADRAPRP